MEIVKYAHIISGIIIGVSGLLQIILKKGGRLHRLLGSIYTAVWIVVLLTGGVLGSLLITLFGVLGYYMALTGSRFGQRKNTELNRPDRVIIFAGVLCALLTLGWGIVLLIKGNTSFGIIAAFFGAIFTLSTVGDLREFIFNKQTKKLSGHKMQWFFEHFIRMYISYIAAMTAFTVIQNPLPHPMMNWVFPTFIGTSIIFITAQRYRRKLAIGS